MIKNIIQKIVKRLSNKNLFFSSLLPTVYFVILVSQVFLLIGPFSQGKFTEVEALRFLLVGSIALSIGHFQYNQIQQNVLNELINDKNQLLIENQAAYNSYDNLLNAVDKIDKKILAHHGITLQIAPKKRTIN